MRVFSYDRVTGAYVGTVYADPNPEEEGKFLIPAFATTTEPPAHIAGKIRVFNAETGQWEQQDAVVAPTVAPAQLSEATWEALAYVAVTAYANAVAVGQGFNSIDEAVSYADESAVISFQAKGRALRSWRSRLWFAYEELMPKITAGDVERPVNDQALFDLLPKFTQQDIDDALAQLTGGTSGG